MPSEPVTRFVPYQSPLASLKSFRFNPTYNEKVKEGYRSLTYNYNIDPKRPLCPTELSGDICTDPACEEQHFRQMTLAGA
jgi:Putative zinc-finger domain